MTKYEQLKRDGVSDAEIATALLSLYKGGDTDFDDADKRTRKKALTLDALELWLAENGISVRYNVVSHGVEVDGVDGTFNPETVKGDLHIILHDALKSRFVCDRGLVADLLGVVAGKNRFNPVTDMLDAAPAWDGKDRVEELFSILHIAGDDSLSRTLLRKWLRQGIAMAKNKITGAYGADGLLVLQGRQGIGKTSFVRKIAVKPELSKLGQYLDSRDKDTMRRCTSCWICEWGEVETTLKSDLERLKAFITSEIDEYRLPYGRTDQSIARRTSLIATCNTERFLIDPTGSRRFWTVPVADIDLAALDAFNALQLWKQIEIEVDADRQSFRLTKEEQDELAKRNTAYEKPLKAQMEVEDILADAENNKTSFVWGYLTVSDFKSENVTLSAYTVEQIGRALDKLGITQERRRIDGQPRRVRKLPKHKWAASRCG